MSKMKKICFSYSMAKNHFIISFIIYLNIWYWPVNSIKQLIGKVNDCKTYVSWEMSGQRCLAVCQLLQSVILTALYHGNSNEFDIILPTLKKIDIREGNKFINGAFEWLPTQSTHTTNI